MGPEAEAPRVVAYIDGASLLASVREAFGHRWLAADLHVLARRVCERQGWRLVHTRLYVSLPPEDEDPEGHAWWSGVMIEQELDGVRVWSRPQESRVVSMPLPGGGTVTRRVSLHHGLSVRLALDAIRIQSAGGQDIALFLSQEADLAELADELRAIAEDQGRAVRVASAYPFATAAAGARGVPRTEHLRMERALYESCVGRR